ncbi:MAG: phenylacetate--CoA ligase family protein [Nitrospirae bacterium]|nr:phenylacetate--CoA ligase family protein [Nitrospirota bacterium]
MIPTILLLKLYDSIFARNILGHLTNLSTQSGLSQQQITELHQSSIFSICEYAIKNVPFYIDKHIRPIDLSVDSFKHIFPVVDKEILRDNLTQFLSTPEVAAKNLIFDNTGGSTGSPLKFAYNKEYRDIRWAIIYHNLSWAGYTLGTPHGFIYGSNYDAKKQYSLRQRLQHIMMNSFQVNAFFLNKSNMLKFAQKCIQKKIKFIIGYASALLAFGRFISESGLRMSLDFVESTAESLSSEERDFLESVFSCKVYNRYGCREVGNIAHECRTHDGMHINWQSVHVEIVNKGKYAWLGDDYGDIVITSLLNKGMPFIRYNIGDIGKLEDKCCSCGIASSRLYLAGTRTGDLLYSIGNSIVSPPALTLAYKDLEDITAIQFVQDKPDHLNVNIARRQTYKAETTEILIRRLKQIFGNQMIIDFIFVPKIEKEASGKFRLTKMIYERQ